MKKTLPAVLATTAALALSPFVQAAATLPAPLLGQWMTTSVGDTYYVTSGGQTNGPSGTGVTFTFTTDGHYSEGAYHNVAMYNCNTGFFGFTEGTVTAANGKLTFKPLKASLRQWATCSGKDTKEDVSDDPNIMKVKTLDYRVAASDTTPGGKVLTLTQANGQPYATLRSNGGAPATTASTTTASRPQSDPRAGQAVSGTVSLPNGQSAKGVVVLACPVDGGCENTASVRYVVITTEGAKANFRLEELGGGQYNLLAWKDLDGDGQYGSGDLAGGYTKDGQNVSTVTAPAQGLAIKLDLVP
ncbi:hypothetical protein [Deinococcus yavapaiensis]|uniref:Chaperone for protein-folding n=1 Tax=Deinococcus yavapaiensis KR-236 TaxID=694435 RepID=A0A318S913_9DEIO|nr:hypothetical protein [Deinococcus yavapaiensis]PYE55195.1 chaperone for protein-folding [Deinococcus yavapaiensis KR-236]